MDANMLETGAKLTVVYARDRSDRHDADVFSVRAPITP